MYLSSKRLTNLRSFITLAAFLFGFAHPASAASFHTRTLIASKAFLVGEIKIDNGTIEDWSDPDGLDAKWTRTGSFKIATVKDSKSAGWVGAASQHVLVAGNGPGRATSAPFMLDGTIHAISYEIGRVTAIGTNYLVLQIQQKNGKWEDKVVAKQSSVFGITKGTLDITRITGLVRLGMATTDGRMVVGQLNIVTDKVSATKSQTDTPPQTGSAVDRETTKTVDISRTSVKPSYHLLYRLARKVRSELTTSVTSTQTTGGELKAYAPIPPNLPWQQTQQVKIWCQEYPLLTPVTTTDAENPEQKYLCLTVPINSGTFQRGDLHFTMQYDVDLYEVQLRQGPPEPGSENRLQTLPANIMSVYTKASSVCDINSPVFQQWMKGCNLIKGAAESNIDFAYRTYMSVIEQARATPNPPKSAKVSSMCTIMNGDCGDWANLFNAIMRANGIASTPLPGRWATTATGNYGQFHVRAAIYGGIGWIPVDQADGVGDGQLQNKSDRWFGYTEGNFISFGICPDLCPEKNRNFTLLQGMVFIHHGPSAYNSPFGNNERDIWKV